MRWSTGGEYLPKIAAGGGVQHSRNGQELRRENRRRQEDKKTRGGKGDLEKRAVKERNKQGYTQYFIQMDIE